MRLKNKKPTNFDKIILADREEMSQLFDKPLNDQEWDQVREWIITDDNMWQVIDECLKNTIDDLKFQWERSNG